MNEEPTGIMEEEILAEENVPASEKLNVSPSEPKKQKKPLEYLRDWFYKLKAPKPISYLILCTLIIVIYTGLLLISTKKGKQTPKPTPQTETTPSPSPPNDPQVDAINKEVDQYNSVIDQINANTRKFVPPNVDLDINFTNKK
jgi:hypothetical protein